MHYCMSDLHGHLEAFGAMLQKIRFSPEDTLYILGDVIDRGNDGVPLLQELLKMPNVHLILGNHEQMCLDTMGRQNRVGARALWLSNGGGPTFAGLMYSRTASQRRRLLEAMAALPDHLDIEVAGRAFHLVHGCPGETTHDRIWGRPNPNAPPPLPGRTVIVGHTPTGHFTGNHGEPYSIWHGNGIIDIDCGCGDNDPNARLACLRLEDMAEFYVNV